MAVMVLQDPMAAMDQLLAVPDLKDQLAPMAVTVVAVVPVV